MIDVKSLWVPATSYKTERDGLSGCCLFPNSDLAICEYITNGQSNEVDAAKLEPLEDLLGLKNSSSSTITIPGGLRAKDFSAVVTNLGAPVNIKRQVISLRLVLFELKPFI